MEFFRKIFAGLHLLLFVLIPVSLFFRFSEQVLIRIVCVTVLIYIFYLVYIQRGIEERYTLPILPVLLINAGIIIHEMDKKLYKTRIKF